MRAIRLTTWCGALVALTQSAAAQTPDVIRDIHIDTRPVFDSADARSPFFRLLNVIHVTTRSSVVRENLTVRPGDHIDSAALAESTRNLRALGIFRSVAIDTTQTPDGAIVGVTTHDAWTTNPQIHLETSGSEATVGGGIRETNFLGTNTVLDGEYTKDPDRSTVALSASRPRLIAGTVGAEVDYQGRSDGTIFDATVSAPFFQLTTRSAGSLNGQLIDARVLQFVGGDPTAARQVRQRSDALIASGGTALSASAASYLRLGLTAQARSDGFRPESAAGPFSRPVTVAVGPYLEYRRTNFYSTRGYEAFGRDEDVDLGLTVRVAAALAPSQWGYPRTGVGPAITILAGSRIPHGFVQANVQAGGLVTGSGVDSGTVTGGATAVFQGGTRHLGIVHVEGGIESHPYPGEEFDLGLGHGARAYDIHAFTGDRMYIAAAEYRYIIVPNALGMEAIGLSVFVDRAGAWYAGSPVRAGTDVGIGVRFGSLRSPSGGMARIDLAYRAATDFEPAKWVLVVGKGFAFNVR